MDTDAVTELQRLGMSAYEAKAYLALVAAGEPLGGYEIAKRSGVPRSTVYETLSKLVARSAAYEVNEPSGSTSYIPVSPTKLFNRIRDNTEDAIENLRTTLGKVREKPSVHYTLRLPTRASVLDTCRDVIASGQSDLMMIIWPEELELLEPPLRRARLSGIDIFIMNFRDEGEYPYGLAFTHATATAEEAAEDIGCRLLVLVSDHNEVVIAGFLDDEAWGVFTDDPAVAMLAAEFIRIDIGVQQFIKKYALEHMSAWLAESEGLREMLRGSTRPMNLLRRLQSDLSAESVDHLSDPTRTTSRGAMNSSRPSRRRKP